MATIRLSVTIPSTLHERLEGMRDRVNVSKVCTVALEKELNMLEARPSIADPKIAQLVERLKGSTQRWYDHGHEDGMQWGVAEARRADLQDAAINFRTYDGRELFQPYMGDREDNDEQEQGGARYALPGVGDLSAREKLWVVRDLGLEREPTYASGEARARFDTAYADVDDAAYLEGWRDALVALWDAVALALR